MAISSSKITIIVAFFCVYVYEIKGRPNTLGNDPAASYQSNLEGGDLFKRSKIASAEKHAQGKGHSNSKGKKKQTIDAYHLGPYHSGHPWGTVSQWPGFHWGGNPHRHSGWTGYPTLGGWHKSTIPRKEKKGETPKNPKKSGTKHGVPTGKRHGLPSFAFPAYGIAYPSLGFAAVPFTPTPIPWGHGAYRSEVPKKTSKGQTRSSTKGSKASKRWWPGYMGGWGGWGVGNGGYPGWGPLGGTLDHGWGGYGHGYGFGGGHGYGLGGDYGYGGYGGFGHGYGWGGGHGGHAFFRDDIPAKTSKKDKASKRWWPGYMGGWGGWGWGNTGYPGWGPLGGDLGYGLGGYDHGFGFGGGFGGGYGGGFGGGYGGGFGHGFGHGFRSDVPNEKGGKEEKGPKRQIVHAPFGDGGYPWAGYGHGLHGYGHGFDGYGPGIDGFGHGFDGYGPGIDGYGNGFEGYGHGFEGYGHAFDGYGHGFDGYGHGFDGYGPGFDGYGPGLDGYGPFGGYGAPFLGHGPYSEALYGDMPYGHPYAGGPYVGVGGLGDSFGGWYGHGHGHGLFKSKIPSSKSKPAAKKGNREEAATSRHFVHGFHPGRYGWGGVNYPGHGFHGVLPLLGAHTYGPYGGGFYGPHGPFHGSFGPYHRSDVPITVEESSPQGRQVINYHPGCYGWGGCNHKGCGYIGGWTWPLPCHEHHHCGCGGCGCSGPCWTRSKAPKKQETKEEKGKSRQDIASPGEEAEVESSDPRQEDPRTHPHLEGSELLNSQMERLAMGFPGIEGLQTPLGANQNAAQMQGFSSQEVESNGENQPQATEPVEGAENMAGMGGLTPDEGGNGFRTAQLGGMEEQQQSASDLLSNFNMGSQEASPAPFSDQGSENPSMDPTAMEAEPSAEGASRRTDIPGEEEVELTKKQAVAYPYHYYYPGYMMQHGLNPYYHYAAAAAAQQAQQQMAYPTAAGYQTAPVGLVPHEASHPSHSIHVGAPNVNVDVQTTREHVAQNPEKEKGGKLKELVGEFSKKLKFKDEKSKSSEEKKVTKRQISPLLSSAVNQPMGITPLRYAGPSPSGLPGGGMFPSMQPTQPFDINAMSRSRLPMLSSSAMGPSAFGMAAFRSPRMRPSLTPAQMAFSRQLSSLTGISVPMVTQPGMGIVGMAQRKKRSPSKKSSKKNKKSTKRQFLAAPSGFPQAYPAFAAFPTAPAALPAFPTLPVAHMQPMAFRAGAFPAFPTHFAAPTAFAPMGLHAALPVAQFPGLMPFAAFPAMQGVPHFAGFPQIQRGGMFRRPAPRRTQDYPQMQQAPEGLGPQAPMYQQEMQQREEQQPAQMNGGGEMAGFNPSSMPLAGQQAAAMMAEQNRGLERSFPMEPQREMASFFQGPGEGGLVEAPSFAMQPGLTALKKSSVPAKKRNKAKGSKSRREMTQ